MGVEAEEGAGERSTNPIAWGCDEQVVRRRMLPVAPILVERCQGCLRGRRRGSLRSGFLPIVKNVSEN